ncbi:MAG TPA: cation:proton antiporter [Bacteroidia bacterium]|nr:cation:proton antiporter [Bacteroidia bacterium]
MTDLELFIKILLALILIVGMAQIAGRLISFIGQPFVVGEMIAGVLLGPTVFGYFFPTLSAAILPKEIMPSLFIISNLGLAIYMFIVGAGLDLKLFTRQTFKDASALSVAAIVTPFLMGGLAAHLFDEEINTMRIDKISMFIFLGSAMAITAFPMLARILQEKGIVHTRIGVLSILSASIQDIFSWILLGLVVVMSTTKDYSSVFLMLTGVAGLTFVHFLLVRPWLSKFAVKVNSFEDLSGKTFGIVILLLLCSALITDVLGLYSVFGGFIFGLALPRKGFFIQAILMRIKDLTILILLPVFFTFSGLNTNLQNLGNLNMLIPTVVIFLFAFASKYVSCTLTMRYVSGFSWRDSSAIGGLVNARGLMELLIANIGLSYGLIGGDLYSILVLVAVCSTLAALPIYTLSRPSTDLKN